jgi:hypothetical protein
VFGVFSHFKVFSFFNPLLGTHNPPLIRSFFGSLFGLRALFRFRAVKVGLVWGMLVGLAAIPALGEEKKDSPDQPKVFSPIPVSSWSLAHLYDIINREPPLNNVDLDQYVRELSLILELKNNPGKAHELLEKTSWTEHRLAYVLTKVGVGLIIILDPEGVEGYGFPDFARPTAAEMELITEREPDVAGSFQKIRREEEKNKPQGQQMKRR